MKLLRRRLTFANVTSLAALFVALGGGAFAAFNPIGSDGDIDACFERRSGDLDVMKGKRCGRNEKPVSWNQKGPQGEQGPPGSDAQFNGAPAGGDLTGTYPSPTLRPAEEWHEVTAQGDPQFQFGWSNFGGTANVNEGVLSTGAFYRARDGVVHLKGVLKPGGYGTGNTIFRLPSGYRPALSSIFPAASFDTNTGFEVGRILITGEQAGPVTAPTGSVVAFQGGNDHLSLDGISFRCGPSGVAGCP